MKRGNDKHAVITLSSESFKHYLIQRYVHNPEIKTWKHLNEISQDLISADTWIQLYKRAKADLERNGGRLTGYEVVDDELVSHERINTQWPIDWMWVMQFSNN